MVGKEGKMKRHLPDWAGLSIPKQKIVFNLYSFDNGTIELHEENELKPCVKSNEYIKACIVLSPRREYMFAKDVAGWITILDIKTHVTIVIDEDVFYELFNIIKPIKE